MVQLCAVINICTTAATSVRRQCDVHRAECACACLASKPMRANHEECRRRRRRRSEPGSKFTPGRRAVTRSRRLEHDGDGDERINASQTDRNKSVEHYSTMDARTHARTDTDGHDDLTTQMRRCIHCDFQTHISRARVEHVGARRRRRHAGAPKPKPPVRCDCNQYSSHNEYTPAYNCVMIGIRNRITDTRIRSMRLERIGGHAHSVCTSLCLQYVWHAITCMHTRMMCNNGNVENRMCDTHKHTHTTRNAGSLLSAG